jgi:hypothetical protein
MERKKTWTQEECDGEANLAYLYMWYRRNSARNEHKPLTNRKDVLMSASVSSSTGK